jgi:hypothetical protein
LYGQQGGYRRLGAELDDPDDDYVARESVCSPPHGQRAAAGNNNDSMTDSRSRVADATPLDSVPTTASNVLLGLGAGLLALGKNPQGAGVSFSGAVNRADLATPAVKAGDLR